MQQNINQQQWCASSLDPQALGTKTTKGQAFRPLSTFSTSFRKCEQKKVQALNIFFKISNMDK